MLNLKNLVVHAQALAVSKLAKALEATDDPAEIRRLSMALLDLDPDQFSDAGADTTPMAVPETPGPRAPQPASPSHRSNSHPFPQRPLTEAELAALHILLPHVRSERFTKKHTPDYWRSVLAQQAQSPPTLVGAA